MLSNGMNKKQTVVLETHLKKFGMKRCPIDNSINMLGKKFTIHIIRNMIMLNQNRFSQFLKSIEGVNGKTLSQRLQEMEKEKLIERRVLNHRPIEVEYSLTKKGMALESLLSFLASFSMKYNSHEIFPDKKPKTLKKAFGTEYPSELYD